MIKRCNNMKKKFNYQNLELNKDRRNSIRHK